MSPLTLRRNYMPRNRRPPAVHQAAASAAAAPQKKHPQAPNLFKEETESSSNANRFDGVKPFKPGFETETELELARAFKRPPRHYKNDPPFYPWLPIVPKVCFQLKFKD